MIAADKRLCWTFLSGYTRRVKSLGPSGALPLSIVRGILILPPRHRRLPPPAVPMSRLALLLPLSILLLPTSAEAGRNARKRAALAARDAAADDANPDASSADGDRASTDAAPSDEAPGDAAAQGDGASIWDYIEGTAVEDDEGPGPEVLLVDTVSAEASEELAEAREAERSIVAEGVLVTAPLDFYADPVGTLEADPLFLDQIDAGEFDIPVVVNDAVVKWLEYFTGRGRKYYARYLSRSTKYQPMMKERLRAAGLPEDLVYLSMIESGYNTHAYSHAAAAGLWQFISSTGRMYDLRVDFWVDERRDPSAATDAAIRLLSDLYGEYGDWYLAWAAYNAGPGRVDRALKRYGKVDFWTMVERDAFRSETDNYIPKLLAAAIIGKHPERYGFTGIDYQEPDAIEPVEVGPSISLDVLARCAGISEEALQELNPQLRRWATPPEPATQTLYLPSGKADSFLAALDKVPPEERLTFVHHKVRRGETLGAIARRYGVGVSDLQKTNRIKNVNRIYPGMDLIVPRPGATPPEALTSTAGGRSSSTVSSASSSRSRSRTTTLTHTVRRGETLSSIASKYGTTISRIRSDNGIRNANHVEAGQRLKVRSTAPSFDSYTVRKGDTLSTIAARHGVSVAQLQADNGISGSRILVGQVLRIRR